jgi:glyoxylase-like metal-dependent hydrolase (beta-lactamase superfamily II)
LLNSVAALRRDHGVERVEVVVPTHYHDDHVAGINLLREVEGTEVWVGENVAPILADPRRYDLPCLWYDPIPADRVLPLGRPVEWREHELTLHPLPGHTLYQTAVAFEVDGRRVLAIGDQQSSENDGAAVLNYQYRNRFRLGDYVRSAELYRTLRPQLFLSGHWPPREVTDDHLERLLSDAHRLDELHRELLPLDDANVGPEGFPLRIEPYRSRVAAGESVELQAVVRNPLPRTARATVRLVVPAGWAAEPTEQELELEPAAEGTIAFRVVAGDGPRRRARVAAELTVDGAALGQQAEALVTVE